MKNLFRIIISLSLLSLTRTEAQTVNIGFESSAPGSYTAANALSGWTLSSLTNTSSCNTPSVWTAGSSEFSIISTPQNLPYLGYLSTSPLGGYNIAQLNNSTPNASSTKLSKTFSVTPSSSMLEFAYAGAWQDGSHLCCDQTSFTIQVNGASGSSCNTVYLIPPGPACQNGITGYTFSTVPGSVAVWCNWQTRNFDLSSYLGNTVTLEVSCSDCTAGDHYGMLFFDAQLGSPYLSAPSSTIISNPDPVSLCPGSSQAVITAPYGQASYLWIAPGNFTLPLPASASSITVAATAGAVYTVVLNNYAGCQSTFTYTIGYSSVNIFAVSSNPSCLSGATGYASVFANGSGSGYTYSWLNSSNSVVATSSSPYDLPAGNYTVTAAAAGSQSATCGVSTVVVTIDTNSVPSTLFKPFCGTEAYLTLFTPVVNAQWYNGTLNPIAPGLGGNSPSLTVSNAVSGDIYLLAFDAINGCRDSLKFILTAAPPGSLAVVQNPSVCADSANGFAVLSMTPTLGSSTSLNAFSVYATGNTAAYSASLSLSSATTFTASGLSAGGTYSVNTFDGSCRYTTSFSVTPYVFYYSLTPSSLTVCSGSSAQSAVTFSVPLSATQYSYSWSPGTFQANTSNQTSMFTPVTSPGSVTTLVYSVVVTPSVINCPLEKTFSLTVANPLTPTITPVPQLCTNSIPYTITAIPAGGTFFSPSASIGTLSGIFDPSQASAGINTFAYTASLLNCIATSAGSFIINTLPVLGFSGNTIICEGQSITLLANGADSYSWSNASSNPYVTLTPSVTSNYTVQGTNFLTGCTGSETITVLVIPQPTVGISGDTLLCLGESTTLTANGASAYFWSTGSSSQSTIITPTATGSYTVIGTSALASCSDAQTITLVINNCTSDPTAIGELNLTEGLLVYPNPSRGNVFIETKTDLRIQLQNEIGQVTLEKEFKAGTYLLDLSNYSQGIYFLRLTNHGASKTIKLVKAE